MTGILDPRKYTTANQAGAPCKQRPQQQSQSRSGEAAEENARTAKGHTGGAHRSGEQSGHIGRETEEAHGRQHTVNTRDQTHGSTQGETEEQTQCKECLQERHGANTRTHRRRHSGKYKGYTRGGGGL